MGVADVARQLTGEELAEQFAEAAESAVAQAMERVNFDPAQPHASMARLAVEVYRAGRIDGIADAQAILEERSWEATAR